MTKENLQKKSCNKDDIKEISLHKEITNTLESIAKVSNELTYPLINMNNDYEVNSFNAVISDNFNKNITNFENKIKQQQAFVKNLIEAYNKCNQILSLFESIKAKRG